MRRRLTGAILAGLLTVGVIAAPASASSNTIADIAVGIRTSPPS